MSITSIPFGLMLHGPGGHMHAWKHPSNPADASVNLPFLTEQVQKAEANGVAFAFVADGLHINEKSIPHFLNRFEPISLLSALATATTKIGLAGTLSTSYSDPFTVARQFGSLDLISGGRAGWNVVTSPLEGSGRNYSRAHPDHASRYEIADEYLTVTQGLWDSWDEDAFPRDRESGTFADKSRFRRLDHKGRFFQVEGPLNIGRSPQGQPVIFQAGSSDAGVGLAGKFADAVFTGPATFDEAVAFRAQVRNSAVAQGRPADHVKIYPGIGIVTGATDAEAEAKFEVVRNLLTIEDALDHLGRYFDHHDFSVYPLDEPFPELGDIGANSFRSTTDRIKSDARDKGLTLRQVALQSATPKPHFLGSAEKVVNELIHWIDGGAADGFILGFPIAAQGLDDFITYVIPELERRARYDRILHGATLRDHLGLPFKESRHVAGAAAVSTRQSA